MPGIEASSPGALTTFTRTFNLGPRAKDMIVQVAHLPGANPSVRRMTPAGGGDGAGEIVVFGAPGGTLAQAAAAPLVFDGTTRVEVAQPEDFDLAGADYTIAARIKTKEGGSLFARAPATKKWAHGGKALFVRKGKLVFDIGWVGEVSSRGRVDDDRWHDVAVTYQHHNGQVRLYIDGRPDGVEKLLPSPDVARHVVRIGYTAADFPAHRTY